MKEKIRERVNEANSLEEVRIKLIEVLTAIKIENPEGQIGYVAGILTSDGPGNLKKNISTLAAFTEKLREIEGFPIFSSTDVFTSELFKKIDAKSYPQEAWLEFWRAILKSRYITDIFMTPRWEESNGAKDEHETAKRIGIYVHYYIV